VTVDFDDVYMRVDAALEAADAGDVPHARDLLRDLKEDLRRKVELRHVCDECGRPFRYPGALEAHQLEAHTWKWHP
jgi:hypothetical protein